MAEKDQLGNVHFVEGWYLSPRERVILKVHTNGKKGEVELQSTEGPKYSVRVDQDVLFSGGLVSKNLRVLAVVPDLDDLTGSEESDSV